MNEKAEVHRALERWAATCNPPLDVIGEPTQVTGGLDTAIWAADLEQADGERLAVVVRIYPTRARAAGAREEGEIIQRLHAMGYAVPRLFDAGGPDGPFGLPFLVMERVTGAPAAVVMGRDPRRIPAVLRVLGHIQAALHQVPIARLGQPSATAEVDRRLDALDPTVLTAEMEPGRAWLLDRSAVARRPDDACCHYDLHPMNVLLDGDLRPTVIDWVGAGIGDRHSDLARSIVLFTWARALAPARFQRVVLRWTSPLMQRRWVSAYEQQLPVDHDALDWWISFHAFDGWVETEVRRADDDPRRHAAGPLRRLFLDRFSARSRTTR